MHQKSVALSATITLCLKVFQQAKFKLGLWNKMMTASVFNWESIPTEMKRQQDTDLVIPEYELTH